MPKRNCKNYYVKSYGTFWFGIFCNMTESFCVDSYNKIILFKNKFDAAKYLKNNRTIYKEVDK